jgi:hypothetical protein
MAGLEALFLCQRRTPAARRNPHQASSSAITEVELPRAVSRARNDRTASVLDGSVTLHDVLASAAIVPLDENIAAKAREVLPIELGALDAIHVASALSLERLAGVATYDKRMQQALGLVGVSLVAPE